MQQQAWNIADNRIPMPIKVGIAVLAASVAALTGAPPAAAQVTGAQPATISVAHADLDLTTSSGRNRLEARVRGAARSLCRPNQAVTFRERLIRISCFQDAVATASADVERLVEYRGDRRAPIRVAARSLERLSAGSR